MIRILYAALAVLLLAGQASAQSLSGSGGGPPTGPAGGDFCVSATYPNPTVCSTQSVAFGYFATGTDAVNLTGGPIPGSLLQVTDTTKTTSYHPVAGDMGQALTLGGTTATLTLDAASSTLFAPGMSLSINVVSSGNWTLTNSTGLTLQGLNSTALVPGTSGTFIANADGTHLDFYPGLQTPTTTALGGAKALAASSNNFFTGLGTDGVFTRAQPAFTDLSGSASVAQLGGSAASHAVPVDVAGTSTWKVVPDCTDTGGNHLNYTQSSDAFSCGTSGGGGSSATLHPGYLASTWYSPFAIGVTLATGSTNTSGTTYCVPGSVMSAVHINALGVNVTTTSNTNHIALAVYDNNAGVPGNKIQDTGSITLGAGTGAYSGSITNTATSATVYWWCVQTDNATVRMTALNGGGSNNLLGSMYLGGSGATVATNNPDAVSVAGTFGVWPSSGASWVNDSGVHGAWITFQVNTVP